jgi:hypothetical protein
MIKVWNLKAPKKCLLLIKKPKGFIKSQVKLVAIHNKLLKRVIFIDNHQRDEKAQVYWQKLNYLKQKLSISNNKKD